MQGNTTGWNRMGLNLKQVFLGGAFLGVVAIVGCNPRSAESHLQDQTAFGEEKPSQETWPESFGWGRTANQNEIDSLSIAIPPSGKGLPDGEGLALRGKSIYLQKCAACHG
jgi:mono/diheme cytochrome c family protein